jgi:hypothetical protein
MPVVTPSRASIDTVKAVSWRVPLARLISSRPSSSTRAGERQADQAAPVGGHEVDRIGRHHLRGDDQVAFVLAVLVVDQDEHPAVAGFLDDLLDGTTAGLSSPSVRAALSLARVSAVGFQPGEVHSRKVLA